MNTRIPWALSITTALLALPIASADPLDGLLPPTDLQTEYHQDTDHARLTWSPVEDADWYNVYRNGELIGSTAETWYVAELGLGTFDPMALFHVTAVQAPPPSTQSGGGGGGAPIESGPSTPVMYGRTGPTCEIVSTSFEPDRYPYFFYGIHEECLPIGTFGLPIQHEWRMIH